MNDVSHELFYSLFVFVALNRNIITVGQIVQYEWIVAIESLNNKIKLSSRSA